MIIIIDFIEYMQEQESGTATSNKLVRQASSMAPVAQAHGTSGTRYVCLRVIDLFQVRRMFINGKFSVIL